MHYYIITNGEYSDYHIEKLIASETPIMADDWKAITQRMEEWLENNVQDNSYSFINDETRDRMFDAVGLTILPYGEYQAEARTFGEGWVVWNNMETYKEAEARKGVSY